MATLIGVQSWRLSVVLALAYLPVEGLLWVALYPHTAPAALAKDFLFVIPAYIGFFYWCMKSKRNFVFPGFPLLAVVLLAGLVIVEIFNPLLDSLLVGLVGAKVWLFYIPMAFLGYHLVRNRSDLDRLLKFMCLMAIIPAVVGIAEAVLYYTGHSSFVYSLYGSAASRRHPGNRGDQRWGRRLPASAQHLLVRRPVLHLHDLDGRLRLRLVAPGSDRIVRAAVGASWSGFSSWWRR